MPAHTRCIRLVLCVGLGLPICVVAAAEPAGAVVEQANPTLPAAKAGIAVDDVIVSVAGPSTAATGVTVRDPFDALVAEQQWSRLGAVKMRVRRGSQVRELAVGADDWGLRLRPVLDPAASAALAAAAAKLEARDAAGFCDGVAPIAEKLVREHAPRRAAWLRWRCAEALADARNWQRSEQSLSDALGALADDPGASAAILLLHATQAMNAQEWERSRSETERALAAARKLDPDSPLAFQAEALTPRREAFQSHFAVAVEQFEPLLARLRQRYPDTLLEADLRNRYALALRNLGRFDASDENYKVAIKLRTALAPKAFDTAGLWMNYSLLKRSRGEEAEALDAVNHAIALYREVAPDSLKLASALSNFATIQWDRGALVDGERTLNESLAIRTRLAPGSFDVAVSLQNLAHFAFERGDIEAAEQLAARGQVLFEKAQPDSNALANAYHFHGLVLERRGDLAGAAAEYQRALALMKKLAPDNLLRQAFPIHDLGGVALKRGERELARKYFEESLAMRQKAAAGGLDEADSLESLGELELELKHFPAAHERFQHAAGNFAQLAPQSRQHALALNGLGRALQGEGKGKEAVQPLCEAARVLDQQRRQVSVSRETQAEYVARYAGIPRACAEARIVAGDGSTAFEVIEQSRARALRERLGTRDEAVALAALSPQLREARADLSQRRAKLEGELASLYKPADADKRSAAMQKLAALQGDEEAWFKALSGAAPRYARELGGGALSASEVLRRLPPDAAALVYLVGTEHSYLLCLTGRDRKLRVFTVREGGATLERSVAALRQRIQAREARATLDPELARLYRQLLAPAEPYLGDARRLLIVADTGLQLLPFAALIDAHGRYLAERWAISLAPSVTLSLEQSVSGVAPSPGGFVAAAVTEARRWPGNGGQDLPALPGTEAEVRAAASAYGDRSTVLVGAAAREPAVRAAARAAGVLHLAAHAYFDPANPIDSGLLLAERGGQPGAAAEDADDDGIVHAWEVMAGWNLNVARLVVLSACDTGVGRELAGEGLIGLTRAFEYAGARNVVATLWPITDATTAPLMGHLHRGFAGGAMAAESLRAAQRELIGAHGAAASVATRGVGGLAPRGEAAPADTSHPYYWAGFEVFGALQ